MINLDRNKLLNHITYLSILKINKMPKTMNSVILLISSAVYRWYIIMVTELYQNTVSQCAKMRNVLYIILSYISRTLKGFQELELLLNSICRGITPDFAYFTRSYMVL